MAGPLPIADPAPADGLLPESAVADAADRAFGVYVHVPFCRVRCGYCDFNTYTATELGSAPGASRGSWADGVIAELGLARRVLGPSDVPVSTVFVGGGTPSLLPAADLARAERVSPPAIATLVRDLLRAGLVVRVADPDDRRRQWIDLTDPGRERLAEEMTSAQGWLEEAVAVALSESEREVLRAAVPLLYRIQSHEVRG